MPEFLNLLPPAEALARLLAAMPGVPAAAEEIDTADAFDRVTARPVISPEALPAFSRSTVDGYAVCARDTFGASDSLPAYLDTAGEVPMGAEPGFMLRRGEAAAIYTGGMLPQGADAVVMVEHTQLTRPRQIEVLRAAAAGENLIRSGADVAEGEIVIAAGVRLRPGEIGGLMALGLIGIAVSRQPRVGILSSGDEVVSPHARPHPGQVRDVNSYTLGALVKQAGGIPIRYGIFPDREQELRAGLEKALLECDLVLLTAGSSASTRDLTAKIIQDAGEPGILAHGVNVRPGKPTILGLCQGKPVIGLPGNPVSALVIAGLFVRPVIERLLGEKPRIAGQLTARLAVNLKSQAGREDWFPVRIIPERDGFLADPVFYQSNLIFSLVRADGLLCIPADATGLSAGENVSVTIL
ncbi:MAG TPA: gephyrin-like molybdotransferase Glp [Anaerolineaceae bacterium]